MKNSITFLPFELGNNPVDYLLGGVEKEGWNIKKISSDYHEFHWPDITLTERRETMPDDDKDIEPTEYDPEDYFELLGKYTPRFSSGYITLFLLTIENTAKKYARISGINSRDAIHMLTEIVLVHEMTHWFVHCIKDNNGKYFRKSRYSTQEEIYFHEGLAQYFTWLVFCSGSVNSHSKLFDWLCNRQKHRYHVYKAITKYSPDKVLTAVEKMRTMGDQNWSTLLKTI